VISSLEPFGSDAVRSAVADLLNPRAAWTICTGTEMAGIPRNPREWVPYNCCRNTAGVEFIAAGVLFGKCAAVRLFSLKFSTVYDSVIQSHCVTKRRTVSSVNHVTYERKVRSRRNLSVSDKVIPADNVQFT